MNNYSVREEPVLRGYTVEWAEPGYFLLSRRDRLYTSTSLVPPFDPVGVVPVPLWRRAVAHIRPAQRLLRHLFYNVIKLRDGSLFVTFDKEVGIVAEGHFHRLEGLIRPCRVLRRGAAVDHKGDVFFGEYLSNRERGPVRIYRYVPGESALEQVYEFPAGSVRHVHGIYHDPFSNALWCLSGDVADECRVSRTFDGFGSLETVGHGDESWRCVSLLFTESHVYYGMDAEFVPNHIFHIDRSSGEREEIGKVDGPVYYSHAFGSDLLFTVTAELCPSQTGRSASLWRVVEGKKLERMLSLEKDALPIGAFMPGTLHFPLGPGLPDEVVFHAVALRGVDNRTFRIRRERVAE